MFTHVAGWMQQSRSCYTATRSNLMIDSSTRVICQGFTGKQVFNNVELCVVCVCESAVLHRVHFTVSRLLHMALTWWEVCLQRREEELTLVYLSSIQYRRYSKYNIHNVLLSCMCMFACVCVYRQRTRQVPRHR